MKKISKKTVLIIIAAIVAIVIIGFLWSSANKRAAQAGQLPTVKVERGNLNAIIGATGTVRAKQTAVLSWQTTGTIATVNVQAGDQVDANDLLAEVAQNSLSQNIILAEADLVGAQQALDKVLNSGTAAAQAQLALANAQKAVDDAQTKRDHLNYKRADSAMIKEAKAQYTVAMDTVKRAEMIYKMYSHLPPNNPDRAQAYSNLFNAQTNRDQKLAALNWYEGNPSDLDITTAEANLAVTKAQLGDAQREWDRLKDGPDVADIAAAQARVDAAQATRNLARLAAPFAGTVTEAYPMIGDQVSPGTAGFRLDDLSSLLVDVQVSEVDINSVKVDQPVTITFDAILGKEYHGKVTQVAQTGEVTQGAVNFTITVALTDADELVKPGMTAAVTITVHAITDALLVPNSAVRVVNSQRVVYIMRNGQTQEVQITLGATSDTMSQVISGDLKAGDLIILNPPANYMNPGGSRGGGMFGGGG